MYQKDANNLVVERPASGDISFRQMIQYHVSGLQRLPVSFELPQSRDALWKALETLGEPQSIFAYWAELRAQRKSEIMSSILSQLPPLTPCLHALQSHSSRNNQTDAVLSTHVINQYLTDETVHGQCNPIVDFPLSMDHQLFISIQHNALRGVMTNMSILLHLNGHTLEGWADFYTEDLPIPPDDAPPSLHLTSLQKIVPHESWIDVIPYAGMRDNILRNQNNLDADELCDDFLGGMYEGLSEVQSRGLVLWGDPWSEDGWEISEGFARKWSFILKGCESLVRSTNVWREARGEEKLVVEV